MDLYSSSWRGFLCSPGDRGDLSELSSDGLLRRPPWSRRKSSPDGLSSGVFDLSSDLLGLSSRLLRFSWDFRSLGLTSGFLSPDFRGLNNGGLSSFDIFGLFCSGLFGLLSGLLGLSSGLFGLSFGLFGLSFGLFVLSSRLFVLSSGLFGLLFGLFGLSFGLFGLSSGLFGLSSGLFGLSSGLFGLSSGLLRLPSDLLGGLCGRSSVFLECSPEGLLGLFSGDFSLDLLKLSAAFLNNPPCFFFS